MSFFSQFKLTRLEQLGLIVLFVFICFGSGYYIINKWLTEPTHVAFSPIDRAAIDSLLKQNNNGNNSSYELNNKKPFQKSNRNKNERVKRFNPNTLNESEWVEFGFSPNQARVLLKYKSKIGGFKDLEDIQKAYVVNDFMYRKIEKAAFFDGAVVEHDTLHKNEESFLVFETKEYQLESIDINVATWEDFKKFKGIGEVLSRRIVKYRDGLGGFYSENQIAEVYGIHDSVYQQMKPNLMVTTNQLKKININIASKDELKSHPYISWKSAEKIINYRMDWGKILDYKTLKKEKLIPSEQLEKIKPYIEF